MKKIAFIITLFSFFLVAITGCSSDKKLSPKITQGEFPFKLTYELNGQAYTINDTVVCNFSGFDSSGGFGTSRTWEEHLKSGNKRFTIISDKDVHSVLNPERVDKSIEVYFDYGNGEYYMGDPDAKSEIHSSPHFCYVETYDKSPKETHVEATPLTKEQLQQYFGIQITGWSFSEPIKNTFE